MKDSDQQDTLSRRDFLRGTLAAGAGATLLVTLPGVASAAPETATPPTDDKQGYRLTPHIAAYYKTAAN